MRLQATSHEQADNDSYWSKVPPLQTTPLNSAIAVVEVATTTLYAKGYAVSGSNGQIDRVEISLDEGDTWHSTQIIYQEGRWSWTLWETRMELSEKERTSGKIWSRAIDESGRTQSRDTSWNLRGVAFSGFGEWIVQSVS